MSTVSGLAAEIYDTELAYETGVAARKSEVVLISGWIEANMGVVNNYINSSFGASDLSETGHLEERAITKELYLTHYYTKQARNILRGIGLPVPENDWQTLREGDSVITRTNKNIVAQNYRKMLENSEAKLKDLVHAYNMYKSEPSQVYGAD
jgi:hypothetical protein